MKNYIKLGGAIIACEAAGIIGAIFTTSEIQTWYAGIVRPSFSPPNWVFGPVWTTLYALMGVSLWLVWISKSKHKKWAVGVFGIQLLLNILWSVLFFGQHNPGAALIEITVLWAAILLTIIACAKISKLAAWLLVPYILWVTFAGFLNYSIWALN